MHEEERRYEFPECSTINIIKIGNVIGDEIEFKIDPEALKDEATCEECGADNRGKTVKAAD